MGVRYRVISAGHFYMEVDGRCINVYAPAAKDAKAFVIDGVRYAVEDENRQRQVKKKTGAAPRDITPPMPSVVVKVLVGPGDEVKQGDPVIVVSAMKMETTLAAPFDGTVVSVNAAAGDKVMPGQILVNIKEYAGTAEGADSRDD